IVAGYKVHPLWQSYELLPLFSLLTAFIMGFSIVIFEGALLKASNTINEDETPLFRKLSNVIKVFLCLFLVLRIGEVVWHGKLPLVLAGDRYSWLFIAEIVLLALPLVMLQSAMRHSARGLFISAMCLLLGAALWRMDYSLIAYNPGNG